MKVKELMDFLSKMNPEAIVVLDGQDHSYDRVREAAPARAEAVGASRRREPHLVQYFDDASKSDPKSALVDVIVIGEG